MLNKKLAPEDVKVFVLADDPPTASSSTVSGLQKTIFENFSKMNYDTCWITADVALQVTFRDPASYYVLSHFDGLAFEHLKNLKCRVYSSFFIHRITRYLLFWGGTNDQETKSQLVHHMMGMVVGPLIDCVTHLVVKDLSVNSPKVECARRSGIRIVTVDSIDKAWQSALANESSEKGLRVQDVDIISVVSPAECFSNRKFYLVKYDDDARIEAEQLIKSNGGLVARIFDDTVDFVLAPVIVTENVLCQERFPSKKLRTFYWMHKCVESHAILYGANELFVPILFHEANLTIFEDCVVALSGLNALDRGVYEMLLLRHGARGPECSL
uniref:BRCT domain-containing protein n=1 Tax=Ditylenchus dipsaci TaxID=166011 RepID=A0A915CX38_9BILA